MSRSRSVSMTGHIDSSSKHRAAVMRGSSISRSATVKANAPALNTITENPDRRFANTTERPENSGRKSCARCGSKRRKLDGHHTRGRLGKLKNNMKYIVLLCRQCHNWTHSNIASARKSGLICAKGLWNTQP